MQTTRALLALMAPLLCALPTVATAQPASWPADSAFAPAFCAGDSTNDKVGDAPAGKDERDIVGDTKHPAFYTADDGIYAFFRVRVNADPVVSKGGNAPLSQFGWGVGMDTDGDLSSIEYAWVVNGIKETVNLTNNKDKKNALKAWSPTLDKTKKGPNGQTFLPVYVEVKKAADGSKFGNNDDYFITVAMHMQQAKDATKSDKNPVDWGKVRLWVSTSTNGFTLDKDFMCWDEAQGIVDLSKAVGDPVIIGPYVDITSKTTVETTKPTLTGTAKPGAKVTVKIGGQTATVTADAKGVWTLAVDAGAGLEDGKTYDVEATTTDNGKTVTAKAKVSVALPPEVKLTSPASSSSTTVDSATPTLTGTALPGAKVSVEIGGKKAEVTADKDGKWSYVVPKSVGLEDGKTYDVKVSASKDGKTATDSAKIAISLPPEVSLTNPKSQTTAASDTRTPKLEGTATPGATVSVEVGGHKGTTTADKDGKWSYEVPESAKLDDGVTVDVKVSVTKGGKTATDTAKLAIDVPASLTLDAPAKPEPTPTPTLSGTAKAGAKVTVEIGGNKATVTADKDGKWSFPVPVGWGLKPGDKTKVKVSTPDGGKTLTKEADLEIASALTVSLLAADAKVSSVTPEIAGKATPGAKVTVVINGKTLTTTAAVDGSWKVSVPKDAGLADGKTYDVQVDAELLGKKASAKGKVTVSLPAQVALTSPAAGQTSTVATTTPTLTGTALPGAKVSVEIGGKKAEVTADKDGKWSYDVPKSAKLEDGKTYDVKVSASKDGKTATDSAKIAVSLPPEVSLTNPKSQTTAASDTRMPKLEGTATPGATVSVEIGGHKGTTTADKDGKWSYEVPESAKLDDGVTVDVKVSVTKGGKTATDTAKLAIDVPASLTLDAPAKPEPTPTPTLSGTAKAGAKVTVEIGGNKATVTADKDGKWSFPVPVGWGLKPGDKTKVKVSTPDGGKTLTKEADLEIASALTVSLLAADAKVSSVTPQITGKATPGAKVTVVINGKTLTTTAATDGTWKVSVPKDAGLADGKTYDVQVDAELLGKKASAKGKLTVSLPAQVALTSPASGKTTTVSSTTPSISGTALPGAKVKLTIGGKTVEVTADKDGKWTATVPADAKLEDGKTYDVQVSVSKEGKTVSDAAKIKVKLPKGTTVDLTSSDAKSDSSTPTLTGVATPGAKVTVTINGTKITTTAGSDGKWSVDVPASAKLTPGKTYDVEVEAEKDGKKAKTKGKLTIEAKPSCTDGKASGDETDVDCGGSCKAGCTLGKGCKLDGDCAEGLCLPAGKDLACTLPASCTDTKLNGLESDVDCGGGCAKCADGKKCLADGDCKSGKCDETVSPFICVPAPSCSDGKQNGDETDVDCGGSCKTKCDSGKGCSKGDDCKSATCNDKGAKPFCEEPLSCGNSKKDGDETDVDCGGSCLNKCISGEGCKAGDDCLSGQCDAGKCGAPNGCTDGKQNGDETDIDCGGSCPNKCAKDLGCKGNDDCSSGLCDTAAQPPICLGGATCTDGKQNGDETDVDCGGACQDTCTVGKKCKSVGDCVFGLDCIDDGQGVLRCTGKPSCDDGVQNGDETDVDCGGSCGDQCADGKGCKEGGDCKSAICDTQASPPVCAPAPSCTDGVKNGDETDVDCGGSCKDGCPVDKGCAKDSDCQPNLACDATAKVCKQPGSCSDGVQNGDETDVDCGGSCGDKCDLGKTCKQSGDCASDLCDAGTCSKPKSDCPNADAKDPDDCDGDGLKNSEEDTNGNGEVDPGETDPYQADTDKDGVTDGKEKEQGSDPTASDLELSGGGCSSGAGGPAGGGMWPLLLLGLALLTWRRRAQA